LIGSNFLVQMYPRDVGLLFGGPPDVERFHEDQKAIDICGEFCCQISVCLNQSPFIQRIDIVLFVH